jgi:hypothetical protein
MNRKFKQFHQYQLSEQSPLNNDDQQFHQLQHNEQLNKKRSQHMNGYMNYHIIIAMTIPPTFKIKYNKMNCELMLTYDTPAYMFNVYKNQLSRQTGSRNLTGPKTLPTIWHTYMKLVGYRMLYGQHYTITR